MANISALLEIIRTAHLGRDMRQALHDSINAVNDDVETCGQTLNVSNDKLQLKRGSDVLSEVTLPGGNVSSVNGQTGAVVLDADDISDSSTTNKFVTASDKTNWNGKSTVSVTQIKSSGEKIATINVDGTDTDIYASAGGGGGGGAVDSVNGMTGDVVLDLDDINDTNISSPSDGDVLVYNGTSGKWENGQGGGGTSDYLDLTNKPQINGVTLSGNKTASELGLSSNNDITSIVATGTTNNSGSAISNGQLFYLNGTLCKALSDISVGATFTLNTNYEQHDMNRTFASVTFNPNGVFKGGVAKQDGVCSFYGEFYCSTVGDIPSVGSTIATIPVGYRPLKAVVGTFIRNSDYKQYTFGIWNNGQVVLLSDGSGMDSWCQGSITYLQGY